MCQVIKAMAIHALDQQIKKHMYCYEGEQLTSDKKHILSDYISAIYFISSMILYIHS